MITKKLFFTFLYIVTAALFAQSIDSDEDGIMDKKDHCPDLFGSKKNKGCPEGMELPPKDWIYDRDRDGIDNFQDKCPDLAGTEDYEGCPHYPVIRLPLDWKISLAEMEKLPLIDLPHAAPFVHVPTQDADRDGILNKEDLCPQTFGISDNRGCPEANALWEKRWKKVADSCKFEPYNNVLTPRTQHALDSFLVYASLVPETAFWEISLYSDDWDNHEENIYLGQERALNIKKYLQEKGMDTEKIRWVFFGRMRPLIEEYNSYAKEVNRRIEIRMLFP